MRKNHIKGFALATAAVFGLLACGGSSSSTDTTAAPVTTDAAADYSMLKVAVVYIGVPDDKGWTYQHEQGILALEAELGIEVKRVENVPEGDEGEAIMEGLAAEGYNLIFATSFGYGTPMARVAAKHADGCFQWATGAKFLLTAEMGGEYATFGDIPANLGTYFGAAEEARYLSGMIAASVSKTGRLGYVAAFPIPEVVRGINAFELGAQAINPKATTKVVWTSTWYDPTIESKAAQSLLNAGVDVLAQHQDSPATGQAAEAVGARWLSYNSNMQTLAPKAWAGGPGWDWGPFYTAQAKAVIDGTWKSEQYYGNMKDGLVKLFGPAEDVPADAAAAVKAAQDAFVAGTAHPFDGPIADQAGKTEVAQGATAPMDALMSMQYFVKGVQGTIAK